MDLTASYRSVVPQDVLDRYAWLETRNAAAILSSTNPDAFDDIVEVLRGFHLRSTDLTSAGGQRSDLARRLDTAFREHGWREGRVDLHVKLLLRLMPYRDAGERQATEHESETKNEGYKVDNVLERVALDVEWNAKDGNLDRDLSAYRALYDAGFIDCAVIITRTMDDLRELATRLSIAIGMTPEAAARRLGTSTTTNTTKLEPRLQRGDGGGCPVLVAAICERTWEGYTPPTNVSTP